MSVGENTQHTSECMLYAATREHVCKFLSRRRRTNKTPKFTRQERQPQPGKLQTTAFPTSRGSEPPQRLFGLGFCIGSNAARAHQRRGFRAERGPSIQRAKRRAGTQCARGERRLVTGLWCNPITATVTAAVTAGGEHNASREREPGTQTRGTDGCHWKPIS